MDTLDEMKELMENKRGLHWLDGAVQKLAKIKQEKSQVQQAGTFRSSLRKKSIRAWLVVNRQNTVVFVKSVLSQDDPVIYFELNIYTRTERTEIT